MSRSDSSEKDIRPDDLTGEFELISVEHPSQSAPAPKVYRTDEQERRPLYRADPDRILRVLAANQFEDPFLAFRELYANALDSTRGVEEAKIEITVTGTQVCFSDNGTGFDDEAQQAPGSSGKLPEGGPACAARTHCLHCSAA